MRAPDRKWLTGLIFTAVMVLLVNLAVTRVFGWQNVVMIGSLLCSVGFFLWLFPGSRFFNLSLANYLAVYACVFTFFLEVNFAPGIRALVANLGFLLPIIAFILGAFWRREEIRSIVTAEHLRGGRDFHRGFIWLIPIAIIGAATFWVPGSGLDAHGRQVFFLAAMGATAVVVFFVSAQVSIFLLDTGLLFEDFFASIGALLRPAFAFFTFYSMQVIFFGALYRIIERFSGEPQFLINGAPGDLSFLDAIYFSLINVSTVGFGDINPLSQGVRVLAGAQIVVGVLLLIFGVSEITRYAREHFVHSKHDGHGRS